jgi:hypothetical protein
MDPAMGHTNQMHTLVPYFPKILLILFSHLHLHLPTGLFTSCFPTKDLYTFLISPMYTTYPVHPTLFDLNLKTPNIVVEWLTLLLRIWEVPDSNFGPKTGYPA